MSASYKLVQNVSCGLDANQMMQVTIRKIASFFVMTFLSFTTGVHAQEKNISLDCEFPRGFILDYFKDRHPHLFDISRLIERYNSEGIAIPEMWELEASATDIFLLIADLEIRSIEINKDFGDAKLLNLDGSIVQLPGDKAEWTASHLKFDKYMPAFSIHYKIDRSDLSFSAFYHSFPPILNELIYWRGSCVILEEPENKF